MGLCKVQLSIFDHEFMMHLPVDIQADFFAVGHRNALEGGPVIMARVLNPFLRQKDASKTLATLHGWEKE